MAANNFFGFDLEKVILDTLGEFRCTGLANVPNFSLSRWGCSSVKANTGCSGLPTKSICRFPNLRWTCALRRSLIFRKMIEIGAVKGMGVVVLVRRVETFLWCRKMMLVAGWRSLRRLSKVEGFVEGAQRHSSSRTGWCFVKEKDERKLNRNRTCTTLIDLVMHQYRRTTDNGFFRKRDRRRDRRNWKTKML